MAGGEVEKYVTACCRHCAKHEPKGGIAMAAAVPLIAALAPAVVPAAVGLFEKLLGLGVQQRGEGFMPFLMGFAANKLAGQGGSILSKGYQRNMSGMTSAFSGLRNHSAKQGNGGALRADANPGQWKCVMPPRAPTPRATRPMETGKGTPGDYSFNELGVRPGQGGGFLANLLGIPQIINAARGRGIGENNNYGDHSIHKSLMGGIQQGGSNLDTQKSDPPIDNVWATHAQLWWFPSQPGLMGRTELPANQYFLRNGTEQGIDVNAEIWEQANDVDEYINSAPTFEDGVTQVAPSTMSYSRAETSDMPRDSTIASTLRDIRGESSGSWARTGTSGKWGEGGFVYAPGMSIERLASAQHRYGMGASSCNSKLGQGGAFSIPHRGGARGGDITRIGKGIIPPESVITGTPVGVSQRGRGSLIKGANIATYST